jgi:hypothetical protein
MRAQQDVTQWILGLAAASLVASAATAAPVVRPAAGAHFVSESGDGCVTTEVGLLVKGTAGGPAKLSLRILRVNECTESALVNTEVVAHLGAGAFSVTPDASSATLNATVPVTDRATKKQGNVTIRLTWAAVEEAVAANTLIEPDGLGRFIRTSAPVRRTLRLATAAGDVAFGADKQLAPATAEDAWVSLITPPGQAR